MICRWTRSRLRPACATSAPTSTCRCRCVSASFSRRKARPARPGGAPGHFDFVRGYLPFDDPDDEPMLIDSVSGGFHWNGTTRRIAIDKTQLNAGPTHFAIAGEVTPPANEGDPWRLALANPEAATFGPERPGEQPIILDHIELAARVDTAAKR